MTAHKAEKSDDTGEMEQLKAEIENLKKALEEKVSVLKSAFDGETVDDIKDKVEGEWDEVKTRIADNPIPSTLVALAIGFIIGRFIAK